MLNFQLHIKGLQFHKSVFVIKHCYNQGAIEASVEVPKVWNIEKRLKVTLKLLEVMFKWNISNFILHS